MATARPAAVTKDLDRLIETLDQAIPAQDESNLLVATWNLRAFSGLTQKWAAGDRDSPKRDWHAVACIAEVVSRFDVVAVQEVRRDISALRFLLASLPGWHVISSDVTEGAAGNGERLCYLYNSERVQPSGLVGEIVLPQSVADRPAEQFARSPYVASFTRNSVEFILATVHVLWGDNAAARLPEITAFAEWMRDWADRSTDWNQNLMVLGDFNIDRLGDPLYDAFVSTGLFPPAVLNEVPRTIFDNDRSRHFYDQIAWFSEPTGESVLQSMTFNHRGGSFDFLPLIFQILTASQVSWRISDHYPLWVEFRT